MTTRQNQAHTAEALDFLERNLSSAAFIKARCYDADGELIGYTYNIAATLFWLHDNFTLVDLHSDEEGGAVSVELESIATFDWYVG